MAWAETNTLWSLDQWAKFRNINPLMFNGADISGCPDVVLSACDKIWFQSKRCPYSREELAYQLHLAELEVKNCIGYFPFPTWVECEEHIIDPCDPCPTVQLDCKKVISGGKLASTKLNTTNNTNINIQYLDEDGDGFSEVLEVIMTGISETVINDVYGVAPQFNGGYSYRAKPYFVDWVDVAGGTLELHFDSWLFLKPELITGTVFHPESAIQICSKPETAHFLDEIDIYYFYNDPCELSVTFYRDNYCPGYTKCADGCICHNETQTGCLTVVNGEHGFVKVTPAILDPENTECPCPFVPVDWSKCNSDKYNRVKIDYYTGEDCTNDLIILQALSYLVMSRMPKVCECICIDPKFGDMTMFVNAVDDTRNFLIPEIWTESPFGMRLGEVLAWQLLHKYKIDNLRGVLI